MRWIVICARLFLLAFAFCAVSLVGGHSTSSAQTDAGRTLQGVIVSLKNDPDPPQSGTNRVQITLSTPTGDPVPLARLSWKVYMAAMGTMPYMEESGEVVSTPEAGAKGKASTYVVEYWLSMEGSWEVELTISGDGQETQRFFSLTTAIPGFKDKNVGPAGSPENTGSLDAGTPRAPPPGEASPLLNVGVQRLQLIGVKFAEASVQELTRDVEAVGLLEADDRKRAEIVPRSDGFVESLAVARVGDAVRAGQALATVYSPELVAAQAEHLIALRATGGSTLASSTREKLRNLGMSETDIRSVESSGRALREVTLRSPIAGTVLQVSIARGSSFRSGQILYVISDLTETYFVARVFQQDLPLIKPGQAALVTLSGVGETFRGQVDLVYPTVAEGAGTANVRIRMAAKSSAFQPGLYASVTFPVSFGAALVVPKEAVMYAGKNRYVFVDRGEGRLEPREVRVGQSGAEMAEVRAGLAAGERVVVSGNFLLSSEALLRSALPKWGLVRLEEGQP